LAGDRDDGPNGECAAVRYRRRVAVVLLAIAAVAATVAALAARTRQDPSPDPDARELQEYRLTMPKVRQMNEAYAAFFRSLKSDPHFQALQKARVELRALEDKDDLTEADEKRIEQLERQVEKAEELGSVDATEQQSLSEMAKAIEKRAPLAAAIKRAGLTPREFAKIQMSLLQAMFAHGFMKAGTAKELPKEVPPENVAFVREHEAELTAMARQWEGVADDGP
jgi:hypothetical protein